MTNLALALNTYPIVATVLEWLATIFDGIGGIVVVLGAAIAVIAYIKQEVLESGHHRFRAIDTLRYEFGQRMILGLEFFLAGDIIRLIVTPTLEGLGRLGAIVAIRTVLSYFLMKETEGTAHNRKTSSQ